MSAAVANPHDLLDKNYTTYVSKANRYYDQVGKTALPPKPEQPVEIEHSKQGQVKPHTIIDSAADWTAAGLKGHESEFTYQFTESDSAELIKAVEKIKLKGVSDEDDVKKLTKEDYDLPTLGPKVLAFGKEVSLGRGFQLVRGFPVDHFKGDRLGLVLAFWGLGVVLGRPLVSQTDYTEDGKTFGSLLNHVTVGRHTSVKANPVAPPATQGKDVPRQRDLTRLAFHSDQGATDLIALLSINKAKSGGTSKWVSGLAIHNELLRRGRKDLVEVLSDPNAWNTPRKVDQASFQRKDDGTFAAYERTPPFEYHDGYLSVHFATNNYQEIELTPLQEEAVWTFARLAEEPEFHFSQILTPGDIEIIHNPTILHSRGDVEDGETVEEKRHLIRWWIAQPKEQNPRPIAPSFAPRGSVQDQGGFRVPEGSNVRLPFFPYTRNDGEGQSAW